MGERLLVLLFVHCLNMTKERLKKKREAFTILTQLRSLSVLPYHVDLHGKDEPEMPDYSPIPLISSFTMGLSFSRSKEAG